MSLSNKERNWLVLFAIYLIILGCNTVTPLVTDDFAYKNFGLDFTVKFNHYMSWSGRVVADFISSAILQLPNRSLMSYINSIPVIVIIYVSLLISKQDKSNISTSAIITCFSSYIVFNPIIAQTTFWLVGAANYLWTSMFCLVYMWILYRIHDGKRDSIIIISFASLIAGCTNESSSVVIAMASALYFAYELFYKREIIKRLFSICLFFAIGSAVLIFSPGNKARMQAADFDSWRAMTFVEHIKLHLFERIPEDMSPIAYSYLFIAALLVITYLIGKRPTKEQVAKYVAIPIIMSVLMALVMFLSPAFPPRALNMTIVMNLIPIGFLVAQTTNYVRMAISIVSIIVFAIVLPGIYADISIGRIG